MDNQINDTLFIIPARGGSKGLPRKNILPLLGKPLICYSIDVARQLVHDDNICVSTDDDEIIGVVEDYGLKVNFIRPAELASDEASTNDVIIHALNYYAKNNRTFDKVVLLQPTSPLRTADQVNEAISLLTGNVEMTVSVKESHSSKVICSEDSNGFLNLTINNQGLRRQEGSVYYEYNGAIYVLRVDSLMEKGLHGITNKVKYEMDYLTSIDIDNKLDWKLAELIIKDEIND